MADEQERRPVAVKLGDQVVTVEKAWMGAERLQLASADLRDAAHSARVRRRFDLDELAQEVGRQDLDWHLMS